MKYFLTRKISASLFGIFFCLGFSSFAEAQFRFDHWTTDNGLPQNGVRGIAQTPDGYLWFTTFDGLVRFDGERFAVFDRNNSEGISNNRFFLLQLEQDGTLFAGTENGGLTVYRNGIFRSYTTADGLPSNTIQAFSKDVRGELLINTPAGNCYFRDGRFMAVNQADYPNNGRFFPAPSGNLWFYDKTGFRQITPDGRSEIYYPLETEYYNDYFSGLKFFEDRSGNLWFGDLNGVYNLKDGKIRKFTAADGVPARVCLRPFLEENDGSIWFASAMPWIEGIGVVRFKDGKFTVWDKKAGLSSLSVANLFKDRENSIWVTTDKGLNRLQKQFIKSFSTADGLVHNEVYPLLRARNGDIYIGTTQGLSRYRDEKFETIDVKNTKGDKIAVSSLFEDDSGVLWVGTVGGLYQLQDGKFGEFSSGFKLTVWAITADREGNIWIASEKGLFKTHGNQIIKKYTTADGLPSDDVKFIHQDRSGALWLGTYEGLAKLENERIVSFTAAEGLAGSRVRTIYEDAQGTLWIGTYDNGLSRFRDGVFFNFTIKDGLFSNGIFQIFEDAKGNFWISCNKGIFRVSKKELEDFADGKIKRIDSVAYGKQDGMLSAEANGGRQPAGIKTEDGKFWFPTQDGVAVVNPNEVLFNIQPPPVKIESVLIEREMVDFRNGIALEANAGNLEIRYTGISFIKSEQVKFRYRIEGLSDEWTDLGAIRDVYFPSLPVGEYTFHVIAANSDGVWNAEGARLRIRVNAPFWRQTWFIALTSLMAVLIAFAVFQLREKELRRKQRAQQEFARKLLESQESERKRIASEMHDSLGQYLLAIKNWALFGLNSLSKKDAARKYLREVSETSSLAIEEVREIAHNLRPYQLERLGLTNTLEYMLKNAAGSSKMKFSTEIENIDGILSKPDEIIFYRIVQESLNNIFKHSRARNVRISLKNLNENLEFICRDDGRGFDFEAAKDSQKSGLGLNGIIERVKILKGEYQIISEPEKGTTVSINIPKFDEHGN